MTERERPDKQDQLDWKTVRHNLPCPTYACFIGREAERQCLHRWLSPDHPGQVVAIDGVAGVGKSALALQVAYDCLNYAASAFQAIVWITAKPSAAGVLYDFYRIIADALGREDIPRASDDRQHVLIVQAVAQQHTLLVIDNLEAIDDQGVNAFLRQLSPPTKAIITTRHPVQADHTIHLVGMDEYDALDLIAACARQRGLVLDSDASRHLAALTSGLPLAIVWSVAQMAFAGHVQPILDRLAGVAGGDVVALCFQSAVHLICDRPATDLLLALSLFATDASREALGAVTGLPVPDLDEGLLVLQNLALVDEAGGRFALSPLAWTCSRAELAQDAARRDLFRERWIEFLSTFLIRHRPRRQQTLEQVIPELDNIQAVIDDCRQADELHLLVALVQHMDFYWWVTGNWHIWDHYVTLAIEIARVQRNDLALANLYRLVATMARFRGDLDRAERYAVQAVEIYARYRVSRWLAAATWRLGSILTDKGDHGRARQHLDDALRMARELDDSNLLARIERQCAALDIAQGRTEEAKEWLLAAQALQAQLSGQGEDVPSPGRVHTDLLLGQVALLQNDHDSARRYFERSLDGARRLAFRHDVALAQLGLAELELTLHNSNQAQTLALAALDTFTALGMKRDSDKSRALLDRIAVHVHRSQK